MELKGGMLDTSWPWREREVRKTMQGWLTTLSGQSCAWVEQQWKLKMWVAQSFKRLTLGFSSGHDHRIWGSSP